MHTLSTLAELPEIDHILVISRDPAALAVARNQGAHTLLEEGTPQLNTALNRATALAKDHKAHSVLVLPADLPLITPRDIRTLLKRGKKEPIVVIAPDRREDGTNGLLMNPAGVIDYGFGPGSFRRHCERARQSGANLEILSSPTLGLDLDLPEDLELVNGLEGLGIHT
jgi:2-phospho-L-lactate guanylyltransferase